MLDNNITLFSVQNENISVKGKTLVLTGCNAILFHDNLPYSELDELTISTLNNNDFGLGKMVIEFCFENNFSQPYLNCYAGCFSIRTDNGVKIKINGQPREKFHTKINNNNKVTVGICYYFCTQQEKLLILNSKEFVAEGYIAFKKQNNVYGIMCRLSKENEAWGFNDGNTYKVYKKKSVTQLIH